MTSHLHHTRRVTVSSCTAPVTWMVSTPLCATPSGSSSTPCSKEMSVLKG